MMAEMAAAIGWADEAAQYRNLFETIRGAFQAAFVQSDGTIGNGSQTGYVLAIRFGLLSPAGQTEAGRRLAADIADRGDKLSTGFLGTPHILDALAEAGQARTAVTLLLQRQYPSSGYMVEKGATTMWERWNSDTGDVAMNSYNHYAFGAISAFLFRRPAGVAPAEPGFRHVRIAPIFDRRLGGAGADYQACVGRIRTDWGLEGAALRSDVSLPPNVSADVVLPVPSNSVRLNGRPLGQNRSRDVRNDPDGVTIRVTGGDYRFTAPF
jgi:alpha-L-rhamnosidase